MKNWTASCRKWSTTRRCCARSDRKPGFPPVRRRRARMPADPKPTTEPQTAADTAVETPSLLDRITEEGRIGQSPEERTSGKVWLKDLVQDVMTGQMTVSKDTEEMIN